MPRYRFNEFIVSPSRRLVVRNGREQPLIPRYFDLLVFLIERRHEAVHRRDIFDRVWSDVVVSDSALTQAIRTIRRTLDDDPREPRFIRTVSRHGYRFVFADLVEEPDDGAWQPDVVAATIAAAADHTGVPAVPEDGPTHPATDIDADGAVANPFEPLLARITRDTVDAGEEEDRREAAELLHTLGTSETLRRLGTRPGHASARALLRDTRWETAGAGQVPLLGQPSPLAAAGALIRLRLRRAARIAAARWAAASIGGGVAGVVGGGVGGLMLAMAPGSAAPLALAPVLAVIGGICGAIGGAGVGAGLSVAEATARSRRTVALVAGAAMGGGIVGAAVQWLGHWSLTALVGLDLTTGGGLEGLLIGGAAGLGYALATSRTEGGMATPRGRQRLNAVAMTAASCGLAALLVTLAGRPLVGGTIHIIAEASQGAQATLTPLGRFAGEPDFGPISRAVIGIGRGRPIRDRPGIRPDSPPVNPGPSGLWGLFPIPKACLTDISQFAHAPLKTRRPRSPMLRR